MPKIEMTIEKRIFLRKVVDLLDEEVKELETTKITGGQFFLNDIIQSHMDDEVDNVADIYEKGTYRHL